MQAVPCSYDFFAIGKYESHLTQLLYRSLEYLLTPNNSIY